jgi:hypothetical protein
MRFQILPTTIAGVEPHVSGFGAPGFENPGYGFDDPALGAETFYENTAIQQGLNANRRSFGWGLEYEPRPQWTFQGSFTRSNAIPSFPRGILNDDRQLIVVQDPDHPGIWLDRLQPFLYNQHVFGLPPYDYYSIMKERIVYRPVENLQLIFHAAQNSYALWGPSDENVNHQGISTDWQIDRRWSAFFDYSHSRVGDIAKLISTNLNVLDFDDHHNFYAKLRYRINTATVLNMSYGVFGKTFYEGSEALPASEYDATNFSLPTLDTEHLFRMSLDGEF